MLLGPEHGLVFVIKCPTLMRCLPQMAPTASHEYLRYLPRPVLPPTSTCAAFHEYLCCLLRVPVLPLTSTCCLPRLPQLRGQLKEVPELVSLEAHGKSTGVIFDVSNGCEAR
jgi:hypothetical protein